ncbi:hypothetical protein HDU83_007891 [Entophlyctis luteolus]|nr:hypothetical protein HDU83_007891 [Entophlyctis luteolus]
MELELPITATVPAAHSEVTYTTAPDKTPVSMLVPQPSLLRAPSSDDDDDGDVDVDVDVDLDEADASADRVSTPRITLPASLQVAQLDSTNSSAPAPEKNASLSGLSVLPTLSRPQDLATTLSPVQVKGHPKSHTHRLVMRQHPRLSRSCGYGEKAERRPIDPPPVIQLEITSHEGSDHLHLYNPYYFMYASLIDCDTDEEVNILHDGKTRSMTGSIVSSLYRLRDLDNKEGSFFVFPDLSVRKEGTFKLKFSLFEICDTEMFFCASIVSNFFTVYSSKKFPGTEETTFLSKAFADQGIKIRVRKETRVRRNSFQDDLLDVNNAALVVRKRESLHESEEKDFRRDGSDWTAHIDKFPVKCTPNDRCSAIPRSVKVVMFNSTCSRIISKCLNRYHLSIMKTFPNTLHHIITHAVQQIYQRDFCQLTSLKVSVTDRFHLE